ncbi:hypothetical protein PS004_23720, partial [Shigella sonnei]|nr:hypothetical protein [Shigella sonnei]
EREGRRGAERRKKRQQQAEEQRGSKAEAAHTADKTRPAEQRTGQIKKNKQTGGDHPKKQTVE